jgi:DNA-binding LacI/PurR family transcriptional regulator
MQTRAYGSTGSVWPNVGQPKLQRCNLKAMAIQGPVAAKAATLHDVARLAGVSPKTVSNVVNDFEHVRPSTRAKVEAAIAELDYQPNLTARSLRSGHTGTIALALPEINLGYFAELAESVLAHAERRGLTVVMELTGGKRERELELLQSPRRQATDGLLFSPLGMEQKDALLLKRPYPIVLLGERIFNGPTDHVTMHNIAAARAGTEYLLRLGRQRIAVIGAHEGEVIGSAGLRLRGYREALAAAGVPFDERLIRYAGPWHRIDGARAAHDLHACGVEFDALFCLNDSLAFGAMRALQESGVRIPEDVALLGFDNVDEGRYSVPSLSTVDPGVDELVETAFEMLEARVQQRSGVAPRQLLSHFRIIARESTAAAGYQSESQLNRR